jgi:ElaB/YqjD/DUF883 family membrane-anchored ribosome-binding protein
MAGLKITREIAAMRDELNAALAVAVLTATKEIEAIRTDGQRQLDELRRRVSDLEQSVVQFGHELRGLHDRLTMVAGSGNAMPTENK